MLLRRRLGLPDVRPGPRKVGLRQAHGRAGRQGAFQQAPMHRLLASAARVRCRRLKRRAFVRSVAKQSMENNQHLRLWVSVAAAREHLIRCVRPRPWTDMSEKRNSFHRSFEPPPVRASTPASE